MSEAEKGIGKAGPVRYFMICEIEWGYGCRERAGVRVKWEGVGEAPGKAEIVEAGMQAYWDALSRKNAKVLEEVIPSDYELETLPPALYSDTIMKTYYPEGKR